MSLLLLSLGAFGCSARAQSYDTKAEGERYLIKGSLLDMLNLGENTRTLIHWPGQQESPDLYWPGGRLTFRVDSQPRGWRFASACTLPETTWQPRTFDAYYATELDYYSQRKVLFERNEGLCTLPKDPQFGGPFVGPCPEPTESSPWTARLLITATCEKGEQQSFAVADILKAGGRWQERAPL